MYFVLLEVSFNYLNVSFSRLTTMVGEEGADFSAIDYASVRRGFLFIWVLRV